MEVNLPDVPDDFPVVPIAADDPNAVQVATCGHCGRSWDDGISTSYTPAPAGRCPFELWHADDAGPAMSGVDAPDADGALEEILEICSWVEHGGYEPDDMRRLQELVFALDGWMRSGGALPQAWRAGR